MTTSDLTITKQAGELAQAGKQAAALNDHGFTDATAEEIVRHINARRTWLHQRGHEGDETRCNELTYLLSRIFATSVLGRSLDTPEQIAKVLDPRIGKQGDHSVAERIAKLTDG